MNTVKPLLPSGSSLLEKRAAECLQEAVTNRIDFENLINPHKCPVKLLPYLAWALSVDYWEEYWSEQQKRQAIIDSYHNHQRKGTVGAVRRIVESLVMILKLESGLKKSEKDKPELLEFLLN